MASFGYGDLRLVSPGLPYGRAPWAHNCKPIVGPKKEKGSCSFLSFWWPRCYGWMASSRWIGEDQAGMSLSEAISSGMQKGSHILRRYLFKLQLFKKLLHTFTVEKLTFWKLCIRKVEVVWQLSFLRTFYCKLSVIPLYMYTYYNKAV
jgi:hypothetical protein